MDGLEVARVTMNLIAICEVGKTDRDETLYPSFDTDGEVILEPDEETLWTGEAQLMQAKQPEGSKIWALPASAEIIATDQRLIYSCWKYDKGATWSGTSVTAQVLTAGSRMHAVARRRGKVAAGQVRYQWPMNVIYSINRTLVGTVSYVLLTCQVGQQNVGLRLEVDRHVGAELSELLVRAIARYRLGHEYSGKNGPDTEGRRRLQEHAAKPTIDDEKAMRGGRTEISLYRLPGALKVPG